MAIAAESRLDSDFEPAGVMRLVRDAVSTAPDIALEIQSQKLTSSKLGLVK
jgi:hypothetical protein